MATTRPGLVLRSSEAFRADPCGGYRAGRNWIYFADTYDLFGYALWGGPAPSDLDELMALFVREGTRPPHGVLADISRLTQAGAAAFSALATYIVSESEVLARIVRHAAVVRPTGMNGATVSGFFSAVPAPFPVSLWDDGVGALAHLGAADPKALYAAVAAAIEATSGVPEALRDLEAYLDEHLASPTLERAAEALSISERTLQRRLSEASTTFSEQVQEARIRRAEACLLETDDSITRIALSLGFTTSQHFSSVFRKRRGVAPTDLRKTRGKND